VATGQTVRASGPLKTSVASKSERGANITLGGTGMITAMASMDASHSHIETTVKTTTTIKDHQNEQVKRSPRSNFRVICLTQHLLIILTTIYFVLAIELTIVWNGIAGVHETTSTSQLIPFIIGIVSTVRAAKEVVLGILRKVRAVGGPRIEIQIADRSAEP
jgi:hypothetical protein